ncbi:type I-E CRISPR-associated protein Cas7/Cse4/CasC [Streptomyces sp. NPDC002387]|uniref:type I-E CRISPR-associated protein Cas7/Cse4/CasC n=1 Tax=Streptomyces sp. NPDC002387 TaxID=3364643 RepID=UPI00369EA686
MYDRYLDLHAVQHYPPSCLNRGEYNEPKTLTIGNALRAIVSSQNQKRNWRLELEAELDEPASRTRMLPPRVAAALREAGWSEELAHFAAGQIARSAIPKGLDTNPAEGHRTQAMLLVAAKNIVEDLTAVCIRHRPALEKVLSDFTASKDTKEQDSGKSRSGKKPAAPPAVLPAQEVAACLTRRTATINLFGRMLAGLSDAEVAGAVQVAPAFTTHNSDLQPDFFTAVEDWPAPGDKGSAHLDTAFLTTGAFYRFTTVNITDLTRNLDGNQDEALNLVGLFIRAFIMTVPPAKKTSTAPHTVPDLVAYTVRDRRPVTYAGAFEQPVKAAPYGGYLTPTYQALDAHAGTLNQLIGTAHRIGHGYATARSEDATHLGTRHNGFDDLIDAALKAATLAPAASA